MRLEKFRTEVLEANLELVRRGLVLYTFGNVAGFRDLTDWWRLSRAAFRTRA